MTSPENNGLLEGSIPSEIGLLTGLRRLYLGRLQEKDSVFNFRFASTNLSFSLVFMFPFVLLSFRTKHPLRMLRWKCIHWIYSTGIDTNDNPQVSDAWYVTLIVWLIGLRSCFVASV
jgi:hypothetical protein